MDKTLYVRCSLKHRFLSYPFYLDIVNLHVNMIYIMREIIFYRTSTGHCPVEKFLGLLPSKHSQKVSWVLSLIEDLPMAPK